MQTGLIICQCAHAGLIAPETLGSLTASLRAHGTPFDLVPDLCELAARRDPRLEAVSRAPRPTVLACHERAVRNLFHMAAAPLDPERALLLDVRTGSAAQALGRLGVPQAAPGSPVEAAPDAPAPAGWIPWFPVIDGARCTNCQQCLGFCLFGVYDLSPEGRVRVASPQSCKTNGHACARICPEVAIIFPKYHESPINGGPVLDEAKEKARIQVDLDAILGTDVYAKLAARRMEVERRRLLRRDVELADAERQRHLDRESRAESESVERRASSRDRSQCTS